MEAWVARVAAEPTLLLRLAARCQHLERWSVPRASFPEGKPGYLAWRRSLYVKQADRARAAGVDAVVFDRGGRRYHGRIAALADAAREGGLQF